MDQTNVSKLSITSSSQAAASKSSKQNGKFAWPEASSIKQSFSLPDSIIYYITKNPSTPNVYSKLAKSCKYFFEKNPILIAKLIHDGGKKLCSNQRSYLCFFRKHKCCVDIDFNKVQSKIWITNCLEFGEKVIPNFASILIPKILPCENAQAYCRQTMKWEAFKLLAKSFQTFDIRSITDINENVVLLDSILEAITNVKEFEFWFNFFAPEATASTMKNILKLKNLDNLQEFYLFSIPEVVAVEDISNFIQKYKGTKYILDFIDVSDAYKAQLDKLVDTVIETELDVLIQYCGQDEEKFSIMDNRRRHYCY